MTMKEDDTTDGRNRFSRRGFLAVSSVATVGVAGCLGGEDDDSDDTGEENEDGTAPDVVEEDDVPGPDPPVVDDPPAAVYKPTHRESMGLLDTVQVGDYLLLPHFTFPHRFWLMRGDDDEPTVADPEDPGLHFMFAFWDAETGNMLPVDITESMTVRQDGNIVDRRDMWPMIAQSMGFHFGDNISLPEEGTYEIEVQLNPIRARKTGAFEGRFEEPVSTEFTFEFDREAQQLATEGVEFLPEEEWGERGALELMDHSGHDHGDHDNGHNDHGDDSHDHGEHDDEHGHDDHNGHDDHEDHDGDHDHGEMGHGEMVLPPADEYPGVDLGVHSSGDADFVVRYIEDSRLAEDGDNYLFISPRTPYNRIPLPDMSLSIEGEIMEAMEDEKRPQQTLDDELGHHYGMTISLEPGDSFEIVVETPPQVSRHQGYETAFLDMPTMTVEFEQ